MDRPVEARVVERPDQTVRRLPPGVTEDGLSVAEFDSFGPTRRTLRQFIAATAELGAMVRDVLVPDPDKA